MNPETKISKKRGPKPSGEKKVPFFARVTPEQKVKIRELLERVRRGGFDGAVASGELVKVTAGIKGGREPEVGWSKASQFVDDATFTKAKEKVFDVHQETMWKLRVSELEDKVKSLEQAGPTVHVGRDEMLTTYKTQNRALLDDIQALTDKVGALEVELEACRNLTYDEKMAYWKERALKAEAYAASKNE